MNKKNVATLAFCVSFVTGCQSLGTGMGSSELRPPQQGSVAPPIELMSAAEPAKYTLTELVEFAIEQAPEVTQAQQRVKASEFALQRQVSERNPRLSGSAELLSGNGFDDTAELALTQPLYTFGRAEAQEKRAALEAQVTRADLKRVQRDTAVQTVDLYYDWRLSAAIRDERRRATTESRSLLERIEQERALGILSDAELTAAQLQNDKLERALLNAETDEERAHAELESALNARLDKERLNSQATVLSEFSVITNEMIDASVANDPALLVKSAELAVLDSEREVIEHANRPTLNAIAKLARENFTTSDRTDSQGVGISFEFNMLPMGAMAAEVGEVQARYEAKLAEYESVYREARATLRRKQRSLDASVRRLEALEPALERAERALASNRRQYSAGAADWRPYFASIAEVSEIRLTLVEAQLIGEAAIARYTAQERWGRKDG